MGLFDDDADDHRTPPGSISGTTDPTDAQVFTTKNAAIEAATNAWPNKVAGVRRSACRQEGVPQGGVRRG